MLLSNAPPRLENILWRNVYERLFLGLSVYSVCLSPTNLHGLMQKWSSSEAPKTTLKRIIVQGEHENSSTNRLPSKAEEKHLKLRPPKGSAAAHSILSDSSATSTLQSKSPSMNLRWLKRIFSAAFFQFQLFNSISDGFSWIKFLQLLLKNT